MNDFDRDDWIDEMERHQREDAARARRPARFALIASVVIGLAVAIVALL